MFAAFFLFADFAAHGKVMSQAALAPVWIGRPPSVVICRLFDCRWVDKKHFPWPHPWYWKNSASHKINSVANLQVLWSLVVDRPIEFERKPSSIEKASVCLSLGDLWWSTPVLTFVFRRLVTLTPYLHNGNDSYLTETNLILNFRHWQGRCRFMMQSLIGPFRCRLVSLAGAYYTRSQIRTLRNSHRQWSWMNPELRRQWVLNFFF